MSDAQAEITRLRSLLPPNAPVTPGTIAFPEDLAWRVSTWLRVLAGSVVSGEIRESVAEDQSAVFRLLTEAPK